LKNTPLDNALFPSESLNSLYPLASLRPLIESIANLTAVDADMFQIPIAEMAPLRGSQTFEILTISSPRTLETSLGQFHFV
jgi:hypothetical protein